MMEPGNQEYRWDGKALRQLEELLAEAEEFIRQPIPAGYHPMGEYGVKGGLPHPADRLDLNPLLDLFPDLHLEHGYELDYFYHSHGIAGSPEIYTRKVGEVEGPVRNRELFLDHFFFTPTPSGYLQLVIFSVISSQFYLHWHANYNDLRFVFSPARARNIISGFWQQEEKDRWRVLLNQVEFKPFLNQLPGRGAALSAITFSKWGGFSRKEWWAAPPAFLKERQSQIVIPYNCGYVF